MIFIRSITNKKYQRMFDGGQCPFCYDHNMAFDKFGGNIIDICASCGAKFTVRIDGTILSRLPCRILEMIPEINRYPNVEVTQTRIDTVRRGFQEFLTS